jgi:hypothetical protein
VIEQIALRRALFAAAVRSGLIPYPGNYLLPIVTFLKISIYESAIFVRTTNYWFEIFTALDFFILDFI